MVVWRADKKDTNIQNMTGYFGRLQVAKSLVLVPIKVLPWRSIDQELSTLTQLECGKLKTVFSPNGVMSDNSAKSIFSGLHYKYQVNTDAKTLSEYLEPFTALTRVKADALVELGDMDNDARLKAVRDELAELPKVTESRLVRNRIFPERGGMPYEDVATTSDSGLYQDILDLYGLELVSDHHTFRCSPKSRSAGAMSDAESLEGLDLDPQSAIFPSQRIISSSTSASARQVSTSAHRENVVLTTSATGDVAYIPRMLQEWKIQNSDIFMINYMKFEQQRYKLFFFFYVFCMFEIFPSQRNLLFPRLVWNKNIYNHVNLMRDLEIEREFWDIYTKAMQDNSNNIGIAPSLRDKLPENIADGQRKRIARELRSKLESKDHGISGNIMPFGSTMDRFDPFFPL